MTQITLADLKQNKAELLDIFQEHGVVNPRLFGELVGGGYDFGSDISLLVEFQKPVDPIDKINLKGAIKDLFLEREDLDSEALCINVATVGGIEEAVKTAKITEAEKDEIIAVANSHPLEQVLEERVGVPHRVGLFSPAAVEASKNLITLQGDPKTGLLQP